ncbi:MAG: metallophosphoesterase family protein [Thermodesulfobacteriota bacterium]|nr:metallophosphoesterase family protein [Thermodesulfobacteriota bacterium]
MRIYAVADVHGKKSRFDVIRDQATRLKADLIVIAGDMAAHFFRQPVSEYLSGMPVPVFAVRGNTDRGFMETTVWPEAGVTSLHLRRVTFQGIIFTGISGAFLLPFQSRVRWREDALIAKARSCMAGASVVVAHPPPLGLLDTVFGRFHAGSRGLKQLVCSKQPPLLLCGHIHEATGVVHKGKTVVVNCSIGRAGAGALIDYTKGSMPVVNML